ncbi:hypothetical protein Pcinc_009345 [Petrolisthes cinctipes]|uniref:Uncharacterized protein n=1 Tax=Petrolisthes cinctipes TaxID=88211 RepID=A0AAE1G751_PETCI|nr:hypothetical protein Pcinc_009345 [Petrolisthes cinctipes]
MWNKTDLPLAKQRYIGLLEGPRVYPLDCLRVLLYSSSLAPRLVQPLDQELIATVKQFYHQRMYDHLCMKMDTQQEVNTLEEENQDDEMNDHNTSSAPPPPP